MRPGLATAPERVTPADHPAPVHLPPAGVLLQDARRWWWLAVAVPLLAMLVALALASREPRIYRATATLAVIPAPGMADEADVARALETLERRTLVATFTRIAETRETKAAAAGRIGGDPLAIQRDVVDAQVVPSTNLMRVQVESRDPRRAAALANAVAAVTATEAARLYRLFAIQRVEAAVVPAGHQRPDVGRSVGVALVIGTVAGVVLALLLALFRRAPSWRGREGA